MAMVFQRLIRHALDVDPFDGAARPGCPRSPGEECAPGNADRERRQEGCGRPGKPAKCGLPKHGERLRICRTRGEFGAPSIRFCCCPARVALGVVRCWTSLEFPASANEVGSDVRVQRFAVRPRRRDKKRFTSCHACPGSLVLLGNPWQPCQALDSSSTKVPMRWGNAGHRATSRETLDNSHFLHLVWKSVARGWNRQE